jgi:hypothetical protein
MVNFSLLKCNNSILFRNGGQNRELSIRPRCEQGLFYFTNHVTCTNHIFDIILNQKTVPAGPDP